MTITERPFSLLSFPSFDPRERERLYVRGKKSTPPPSPSRQEQRGRFQRPKQTEKANAINLSLPPSQNSLRHGNCELAGPTFSGSIAPVFVSNLLSHQLLAHRLLTWPSHSLPCLLALPCCTLTFTEYLSLRPCLSSLALSARFACSTTEEERAALVSPLPGSATLFWKWKSFAHPPTPCGGLHKLAFPRSLPA